MTLLDLDTSPLSPMYCLGNCGKLLWDPKSRKLGYGRDCAEKLGIIPPAPPHFTKKAGGDCEGQTSLIEDYG